jgi:Ca2+-binding RTX toxin-like protein
LEIGGEKDGSGGIRGTEGNNILDFSGLTEIVSGGKGEDPVLNVSGLGGNDTITGSNFDDHINGGAGNDILKGGLGNDVLDGGAGVDNIDGGAGDDTIIISDSEALNDIIKGGADTDTIEVSGKSGAVTLLNFGGNSIEHWEGNGTAVLGTGAANVLDFSGLGLVFGIASIDGGGGNDTITGSYTADRILGGAGADILAGGGSADTFVIKWNEGIDTIKDFVSIDDTIELNFSAAGKAEPVNFVQGSGTGLPAYTLLVPALIYDQDDGKVYYDPGAGVAVQIALLADKATLDFTDFTFI